MRDLDLEYTYKLEENFWWFQGMRNITWSWIGGLRPRTILDAGCGTGFHLRWLQQNLSPARSVGIDLSATALSFARKRDRTGRLARASITHLPFAAESFDLVTSFDVISQIPPDLVPLALLEFHRVLQPGGCFFLRVPAAGWLRSSHDEELQTHTRFSLSVLVALLSDAGFVVSRKSYVNFFLFPIAAARRLLKRLGLFSGSDVRPFPRALGFLEPVFLSALNQEARLLKRPAACFPFGLTAAVFAQKPSVGHSPR